MAIDDKPKTEGNVTGRRVLAGTNVTIFSLLVIVLVVGVNFLARIDSLQSRQDLSGGFTSSRLSDRTERILDQIEQDIRITTVYTSQEAEYDRDKYFPNLKDLCREIRQAAGEKEIEVEHLHSGDQASDLRERLQGKFGSAANEHDQVIAKSQALWNELEDLVGPVRQEIMTLQNTQGAWLQRFTRLTRHVINLRRDLEAVQETKDKVTRLLEDETIPLYEEATNEIKDTHSDLKEDLQDLREWLAEMDDLADALSDADSEFATRTRDTLRALEPEVQELVETIGEPDEQTVPDDPRPVLQEFARKAKALAGLIEDEATRVNAFVQDHPAIQDHPDWLEDVVLGGLIPTKMPISELLAETDDYLLQRVAQVRDVLAREDIAKDRLQLEIRQQRKTAAEVGARFDVWKRGVRAVLEGGRQIDAASRDLMARAADEELFPVVLERLEEIEKQIEDLPDLALDELAESLQEDNIVVIEIGEDVEVVKFDDVWPLADPSGRARMPMDDDEPQRRVFDGDSAIGSTLLTMTADKPYATVIFVGYETSPPPQMMQMGQRPNVGRLPLSQFETITDKLEQANFAVKQWNLGAEGAEAEQPEPEEGTKPVYVFLPPAQAPPPMMRQQQPQKQFGEAELEKIRALLNEEGASSVFLAAWEPPRSMGMFRTMPSTYAYDDLLNERWGIEVWQDYRLLQGVQDTRDVDLYAIAIEQIGHMQLSSFTDHPIGDPLQARRMLMTDVCPVTRTGVAPHGGDVPQPEPKEGVKIEPVLRVPKSIRDIWAESNQGIQRIGEIITAGDRRGMFEKDPETSWEPPFNVILAVEETGGEEGGAPRRSVVMGTGASLMDFHLTRRAPRFEGEGRRAKFVTDPPPIECAEMLVNAVYWLSEEPEMIAAGPADAPRVPVLEEGTKLRVTMITLGWALVAFVAGMAVWIVRRK